jgi:hypothetical protein
VPVDGDLLLEESERALEAGAWSAARSSFAVALEVEESPEALLGLASVWGFCFRGEA